MHIAATYGLKLQPIAILIETAAAVLTDDALVGGLAGAFGCAVSAPGVSPLGAALVVACPAVCHDRGELVGIGAFGVGVHGERAVVVGQDHPQAVGGGVFVASAQLVHLGGVEQVAVLVVGFTGRSGCRCRAWLSSRPRDIAT